MIQDKKIIWVNGCFDIIHSGHIELLEYAKSLGDYLIVGLDSDERVRQSKGKHRPILPLDERMRIISSLSCVDEVCSFNTDDELRFKININYVDFIVVGEEYKNKTVIGEEYSDGVKFFKKIENKSTTNVVDRILNEYCKERFYGK